MKLVIHTELSVSAEGKFYDLAFSWIICVLNIAHPEENSHSSKFELNFDTFLLNKIGS